MNFNKKFSHIDYLIKNLIIFGMLLVPFLNIGEIYALFMGTLKSQTELYTSIYLKVLKDLVMLLIILLLFIKQIQRKFKLYNFLLIFFIIFILWINIANTLLQDKYEFVIYGLRWFYPLLILILLYKSFQEGYLDRKFDKVFTFIFIIHFSVQFYQFFSGVSWFGLLGEKYSARNPGIFLLPNTGAFFSIIYFYWLMYFSSIKGIFRKLLFFICIVSVILTSSGTGFVVLSILMLIYFLPKNFIIFYPFLAVLSFFFMKIIFSFTRGEEYVEVSGGTRLDIFLDLMGKTGLISSNFGYFTNTAVLINKEGSIVDSTYSSVVGNLGLIFLLIFALFLLFLFTEAYIKIDKQKLAFLAIVLLFSATTIITEAYPMNLLLPFMAYKLYAGAKYEHRFHNF